MGVLRCGVKGCPGIMCDRFSSKLQEYICQDCFDRLVSKGVLNTAGIRDFFNTEPEEKDDLVDAKKYYSEIFVMREW